MSSNDSSIVFIEKIINKLNILGIYFLKCSWVIDKFFRVIIIDLVVVKFFLCLFVFILLEDVIVWNKIVFIYLNYVGMMVNSCS